MSARRNTILIRKNAAPLLPAAAKKAPSILWRVAAAALLGIILLGVILRIYGIHKSGFFFFDAGMYLNWGRILLENTTGGKMPFGQVMAEWFGNALKTDRPLWQLIVDSRVFWGGLEIWWQTRCIALVFGLGTLALTYAFARRLFQSTRAALLSVAFLAVLPSHVFYSRALLPEAASAFFVLAGFYLYLFKKEFGINVFAAGLCFVAAFFTNYRLAVLPLLLAAAEVYLSWTQRRIVDVRKWVLTLSTFAICLGAVALLGDGTYFNVTTAWMFHQVENARSVAAWYNLFSYPYEIFRLEGFFFGVLFFAGFYLVRKRRTAWLLPFLLACLQMALFTLTADKAARYMSIVMPFKAMAAAALVMVLWEDFKDAVVRAVIILMVCLAFGTMVFKSVELASCRSGYRAAMEWMTSTAPGKKILSTQPLVMNLYTKDRLSVVPCPAPRDPVFFSLSPDEYHYLTLGPQAFVSWTQDNVSFSGLLDGVPGFFWGRVKPVKIFPHLNKAMLERFVFEHNHDLLRSIAFLDNPGESAGELRIYDLHAGLEQFKAVVDQRTKR